MVSSADDRRIFVLIPSYRDPECHPTINDLFAKASHPERIFAGLCWQYDAAADAEYLKIPLTRPEQVRTVHFPLEECEGAGWARNEALKLWNGEPYLLQLQAHHRFEPGWDEELIAMLERCPSARPVITGWLPGYMPPDKRSMPEGRTTRYFYNECQVNGDPQMAHLMYRAVDELSIRLPGPLPCPSWVGNFMFARSEILQEVPFDPHIYFWGEEVNFSARAWTHGWDFFQFDRTVAYHYWDRDKPKGAREYRDFQNPRNVKTCKRLRHLFGLEESDDPVAISELDHYRLGTERTLVEYWRFAGLEMPAGKILSRARRGAWTQTSKPAGLPRIFVQIASYRDPECQYTVRELFAKAAHPERIFVGLCWQFDPETDQHCFEIPYARPEQVRVMGVNARDSQGAGWGRSQAGLLRNGEEYTLLIDAHMRFEQDWDETLLSAMERAPSAKPVITAYCSGYRPGTNKTDGVARWRIRVNALGGEKDPQMVHLTGMIADANDARGDLYPTPFCIFHLIFARSEAFDEVPVDPHIMFWGDEITHAARLYTHGYDIFQPDQSLAYHLWDREEEQKSLPYRPLQNPRNRRSAARVRHLFGLEKSADRKVTQELELYGLGKVRSLEGFFRFAGIDPKGRTVRPASHKGYWFRSPEPAGKGKIFVSIASYRDPECQHTVADLFAKAAHPENIAVGICWQFDAEKDRHCFEVPSPRPGQVRIAAVDWRETQGVCWARWMIQSMWQGEEYTLQIDSHSRFTEGWDEKLVAELQACPSVKPVLSGCIARYTPPDELEPDARPSVLRAGVFTPDGNIRNRGAFLLKEPELPLTGAFISAGFIFFRSQMLREVPYDPYLSFDQEEIVFSARLYTHGWNIYSSRRPFIYHHYVKPGDTAPRPLPGHDMRADEKLSRRYELLRTRGLKRMQHVLGQAKTEDREALRDLGPFGLGGARSLSEYENYCGIDFAQKRVSEYALRARFIPDLLKYVGGIHVPEIDDKLALPPVLMSEDERVAKLGRPSPVAAKMSPGVGRIFVQIASYRDPECQHTVADLFAKATHPENIFVGICWLFDTEADRHCFEVAAPRPDQVRVKRYHHTQSCGTSWARAEAQSLMQDEEYTLQIDSHMRLTQGWDEALIAMLQRAPAPKAAITALLPGYEPPDLLPPPEERLTRLRVQSVVPPHMVALNLEADIISDDRQGLYPTPFIAESFVFARSQMFADVPVDPYIGPAFALCHGLRLWTYGYALFQPDAPVAFHRPRGLQGIEIKTVPANGDPRLQQAYRRARHLLGLEFCDDEESLKDLDHYGHGTQRSVESFWEFAGVDLEKGTLTEAAKKGEWGMNTAGQQLSQQPRIFVQIASYRDPECQYTVKELFESAAHPERIFVGIIWQYIRDEDQYCFAVPCPRPEQVRIIHVDARESRGVCWARAQLPQLWQGEEYTLQIDSHMRFEPGWDDALVAELAACPTPKAVLTTYPAGYTPPRDIAHRVTYRLIAKDFDQDGIFTMSSRPIPQNPPPEAPVLGAFAGACMLFGPSIIMQEVPYDPRLYFFGEEISMSARLWTHGYDIYHPTKPLMYHFWERKARRTHFDDYSQWPKLNQLSFKRVRHLLGSEISTDPEVLADLGRHGLGKTRSLQQYQQFCGVNFATQQISPAAYEGTFPADKAKVPLQARPRQAAQKQAGQQRQPQQQGKPQGPQAQKMPQARRVQAQGNGNGAGHIVRNSGPRKVLETEDIIVYDDFLPQDVYDRLFDFVSQTDYHYINTQGKVKRVWDMTNGFPLRSEKNVFYYAPGMQKPAGNWVYPGKTPLDRFVEHINPMVPEVQHLVGEPGAWEHFSVTGWIYPPNTGLSMHDDGSGVYTGAYVFFMNETWRPHWGGLLIVLDSASNKAIQNHKKGVNAYKFHMQKWLHITEHDELAMESGLAQCIFPKANRMVFLHPEAFHMVTQVSPAAGDHVRMSLAGFFHRGKQGQQAAQQGNGPPENY